MVPKREEGLDDANVGDEHDGVVPNINNLVTFIEAYKQLQVDNTNLRNELSDRIHEHEQAEAQVRQAADHQEANHTEMVKAMNEEMDLLRREKEDLRQGISDLQSEKVTVRGEVARLEAKNLELQTSVEGLHQSIREGKQKYDDYRERVKALGNEFC